MSSPQIQGDRRWKENGPLAPTLSPSEGERENRRERFARQGSWSQCMGESETRLPMNRKGRARSALRAGPPLAGDQGVPNPVRGGQRTARPTFRRLSTVPISLILGYALAINGYSKRCRIAGVARESRSGGVRSIRPGRL